MGGFLSFVKKEALHILRDKRTMLIVLLLPIVQILLFGFAISTEMNNIDFAVVAPNRTETIRQQIERMEILHSKDIFLRPRSTMFCGKAMLPRWWFFLRIMIGW